LVREVENVVCDAADDLSKEFRQFTTWKENFVKSSRMDDGGHYQKALERVEEQITHGKEQLEDLRASLGSQTRGLVHRTERIMHAHPWQTAGTAALATLLLGVVVGLIVGRAMTQHDQ
jgi:ElaB/YqjD/DUF883 family membrane-anchored ribosome-binding protein